MTYVPPKIEQVNYPAPATAMAMRQLSSISDIIIHHTAGPLSQTALEIDQEHRAEGWAGIGYNYVIDKDGVIFAGRPDMYVPAAAFGRNAESTNIVIIGDFQSNDSGYTGEPGSAQLESLKALVLYLHKKYPSIARTIGHRDVATMFYPADQAPYATACPGDKLYAHLADVKTYVQENMKPT